MYILALQHWACWCSLWMTDNKVASYETRPVQLLCDYKCGQVYWLSNLWTPNHDHLTSQITSRIIIVIKCQFDTISKTNRTTIVPSWGTSAVTSLARCPAANDYILSPFYPRNAMLARVIEIATCLSVCPSVCPCIRLSRAGIVSKRRKLAAWFLHHLVAPRL